MRLFAFVLISVVSFVFSVQAQTPQQLEMLKNRDDYKYGENGENFEPVYIDEKTGEVVIPTNKNPKMMELKEGVIVPVPMAKTDAEAKATLYGVKPKLMAQMNEEQRDRYLDYVFQDRIILATTDFLITTTSTGMKYCQMHLNVHNNTPRLLKKMRVQYTWGDVKTSAEFRNVDVLGTSTASIALAGSVCDKVIDGAKYDVTECSMEGLTRSQCRLRVAEL